MTFLTRNRCRGGPSCAGSARRWRCRSSTRWFPRCRGTRAAAQARRIGSRRSMCRTAWRWSTGRRKARGRAFELSPILEPLAPFRNQMLVLSGLKANWNYIHAGASGSFLTGTTRGGRNEVEIIADVSMDQLLARQFAQRDAGGVARARDGSRRPTPARAPAT